MEKDSFNRMVGIFLKRLNLIRHFTRSQHALHFLASTLTTVALVQNHNRSIRVFLPNPTCGMMMNAQYNNDVALQFDYERIRLRLKEFYSFTSRSFYTSFDDDDEAVMTFDFDDTDNDDDISESVGGSMGYWQAIDQDDTLSYASRIKSVASVRSRPRQYKRPRSKRGDRGFSRVAQVQAYTKNDDGDDNSQRTTKMTISFGTVDEDDSRSEMKDDEEMSVHTSNTGHYSYYTSASCHTTTTASSVLELKARKRMIEKKIQDIENKYRRRFPTKRSETSGDLGLDNEYDR